MEATPSNQKVEHAAAVLAALCWFIVQLRESEALPIRSSTAVAYSSTE